MNVIDQVRYSMWRLELWNRNYGSGRRIDQDVSDGKLIPGTMPDALWEEGDNWSKQSDVAKAMKKDGKK